SDSRGTHRTFLTWAILIGGIAVIAGLAWLFIPSEPAPFYPEPTVGVITGTTGPDGETQLLRDQAEKFLHTGDWSPAGVAELHRQWRESSPQVRAEARTETWFYNLTDALNHQITQERNLAELKASPEAAGNVARLQTFARSLEPDQEQAPPEANEPTTGPVTIPPATLPNGADTDGAQTEIATAARSLEPDQEQAPPEAIEPATRPVTIPPATLPNGADTDGAQTEIATAARSLEPDQGQAPPEANEPATVPVTIPPATLPIEVDTDKAQTEIAAAIAPQNGKVFADGYTWLKNQTGNKFTLQLFALNQRENVLKLLANHPQLGLKAIISTDEGSRYRILYGLFDTESAAHTAHKHIPLGISTESHLPNIKTIAEMLEMALIEE
ncbi:MAG: hypothetical protein GY731_00815, partial [Gammaproteobacteria bacterium]|nr:hypothetical protein [Gammaproteobacteria bacterium]